MTRCRQEAAICEQVAAAYTDSENARLRALRFAETMLATYIAGSWPHDRFQQVYDLLVLPSDKETP